MKPTLLNIINLEKPQLLGSFLKQNIMKRIEFVRGYAKIGAFTIEAVWREEYYGEVVAGESYWDDIPSVIEVKRASIRRDLSITDLKEFEIPVAMIGGGEFTEERRMYGEGSYKLLEM